MDGAAAKSVVRLQGVSLVIKFDHGEKLSALPRKAGKERLGKGEGLYPLVGRQEPQVGCQGSIRDSGVADSPLMSFPINRSCTPYRDLE
jgi:hypothetical protein